MFIARIARGEAVASLYLPKEEILVCQRLLNTCQTVCKESDDFHMARQSCTPRVEVGAKLQVMGWDLG
uniref:Uncharacterized protein n=1 Tax=Timema genevievae TaxID=629358 RepID=A0A7R9JWS2_TIMGE|nr:unnamed protein product [Timema genevievae]